MNIKKWGFKKSIMIKLKRIFALVVAFAMVISLIPNIDIFANDSYDYKYVGVSDNNWGENVNLGYKTSATALFNVKNPDGTTSNAYCVDLDTGIVKNHLYSRVNVEDANYYTADNAKKIRAIVRKSYPFVSIDTVRTTFGISTLSEKEAITATQLAIWRYANKAESPVLADGNIKTLYEKLITLSGENGPVSVAKIISKDPIMVLGNGDKADIEFIFKVDGKNVSGTDIDLNYKVNNKPDDSKIIDNGKVDQEGFRHVRITNIPSGTNIQFIVSAVQDVGTDVFFYEPQNGRKASQSMIGVQSGETNISETFNYKCVFREVEVTKVDKENNNIVLEGAEFTIKNSRGEVVKVITTGKNGIASTKLLPGSYTIEETKAPQGYKIIDGKKDFKISDSQTTKITFKFTNEKLIIPTNINLQATKKLIGKDLKEGMFNFKVYEGNNEVASGTNKENGTIEFSTITYKNEGTHTYFIKEEKGNLGGISYDERAFQVTVNVTRNNDGTLVATPTYPEGGVVFNNSYKADSTSALIEATKILEGKDLEKDMFSFELLDKDGEVLQTVQNSSDGKVQFKPITYTTVGEYIYKVKEKKGSLGGITYDNKVYNVKVDVTDNQEGSLVAEVIYPNEEGIVFTNKYEAKPASVKLEATKKLTGKLLLPNMFTFKLLDNNGGEIETVKNALFGKIKFNELTFDKVGTYTYQIIEVNEGLGGMTYDSQPVDVTIKVTDNGQGQLESSVSYPSKQPEFKNSYKAGSTSVAIKATKRLEGEDLGAGMFSFELLDKSGKVIETVKNSLDGKVQFTAITYDKEGTYEYIVKEAKSNLGGVAYDDREFEVTVKVTDNGKGNLVAEVVYPEGGVVFKNTVKKGSLEFTKTDVSTGEVIEGAHIKITCTEGLDKGKVIEFISSKEGNKFELKVGKYTFEETQAPEGYELSTEVGEFEIKENGEVVKAELKNHPTKGNLEFTKTDISTGEVIEGAKIKITCTEGLDKGKVIEFTSSKKGNKFNLKVGKYTFEETQAPKGYELLTEVGTFEIKENGEVVKAELKNYPTKGILEFEKKDVSTGEVIEGAKIKITCTEGLDKGKVIEFISSKKGNKFELKAGKYTFEETQAPEGYELSTEVGTFEIKENGEVVRAQLKNYPIKPVFKPNINSPQTSDTSSITGYAISSIVAAGALLGINRKRKNK